MADVITLYSRDQKSFLTMNGTATEYFDCSLRLNEAQAWENAAPQLAALPPRYNNKSVKKLGVELVNSFWDSSTR